MTRHAAWLLALVPAVAAAASPSPSPAFERPIGVAAPGRTAVRLERDVYESARPDLGDLRVLDEAGRLAPFVIDGGETTAREGERRPALLNRGRAGGEASVDLDFGPVPGRRSRLQLRLSGDNFRRAVSVAGSVDGREWTTLVDEAWVFAVPGSPASRYEAVELPPNDFALLRVRVRPGPDERERVTIEGAWVPAGDGRVRREEAIHPRSSRAETPDHETWLTLDLGAAHQPLRGVELEVAEPRFFREAIVEARRDIPGAGGRPGQTVWVEIGRGALYRLGAAGRTAECLRVAAVGRERVLRVRVRNRDDRPLDVRAVRVIVPVERVVFEATPGRAYRLAYGSSAPAPQFDLARTVGDVGAWADGAAPASLGPARRRAAGDAGNVPWTERHPALLWAGLAAVVLALGAMTWRALPRDRSR